MQGVSVIWGQPGQGSGFCLQRRPVGFTRAVTVGLGALGTGQELRLHWRKTRWCSEHLSTCRSGSPGSQAHGTFLTVFLSKKHERGSCAGRSPAAPSLGRELVLREGGQAGCLQSQVCLHPAFVAGHTAQPDWN